mmetsp:Transcript_35115/g.46227  ORF Transcript_35115/g.46227 Transcript_35115/m.46227 type:complete len:103 (-) Transcript_35115:1074-1382(-)
MLEVSYRDRLYQDSLTFIKKIQKDSTEAEAKVWDTYSNLGIAIAVAVPPFVFYLIFWKRLKTLYYVVFISTMLFIMNISKLWYHEERPFWDTPEIHAYNCNN